jgi:alpha-amylase/alpha-mannosidase (GH57 family)
MDAKDAAVDCLRRLRRIRDSVRGKVKRPLVTIAMDGENAWENYRNDGRDFLRYLYEGILSENDIEPVTISEYLENAEEFGGLTHCFAGSWIGHNFSIWIGHSEDNKVGHSSHRHVMYWKQKTLTTPIKMHGSRFI